MSKIKLNNKQHQKKAVIDKSRQTKNSLTLGYESLDKQIKNFKPQNSPKYLNPSTNKLDTSFIPQSQRYPISTKNLVKAIPDSKKVLDPSTQIKQEDKVYLSDDQLTNLIEGITKQNISLNNEVAFKKPKKEFPKPKNQEFISKINSIWDETSHEMPFHHLEVQDTSITGKHITVNNKKVVNFGSCSYLGLEHRKELKDKAIEAIQNYGTQYSSSVTYMSLNLYSTLREKYKKIFGGNVIIAPTTTLGHASCIPLLGDEYDLFLLDQQVHNSVQMGVQLAAAKGTKVITLPHNNLQALESKLQKLQHEHRRIWYFCDGIYSMYGDCAPIEELEKLRDKYSNLHLYIDDAHGTTWTGKNGCGYAIDNLKSLNKTIVAASNNKAFAGAGATFVIQDKDIYNCVSNFGQTLIFSGPIQPSGLGACLGSADIHLSSEITQLQQKLKNKINLRNKLFEDHNIPFFKAITPISFVCVGSPKTLGKLFHKLYQDGFYTNCAVYPAVSKYKSGLRTTLTLNISDQDIIRFTKKLAHHLPKVLQAENTTIDELRKRFKLPQKTQQYAYS